MTPPSDDAAACDCDDLMGGTLLHGHAKDLHRALEAERAKVVSFAWGVRSELGSVNTSVLHAAGFPNEAHAIDRLKEEAEALLARERRT